MAVFLRESRIRVSAAVEESVCLGSGSTEKLGAQGKQGKMTAFFGDGKGKDKEEDAGGVKGVAEGGRGARGGDESDIVTTLRSISYDISQDPRFCGEGRLITLEFDGFYLVNCYVPNAGQGLKRIDYRYGYIQTNIVLVS